MYRHLLVLTAAGSLQPSCMLYAQAYALGPKFTLARRETATDDLHESFFIPAVVASGVVFLLGILCVLMLVLTSSARNRPSIPHTHEIDHDQHTRPMPDLQPTSPRPRSAYLSRGNTASNTTGSGSFYYNEPPSNKIQRKPAPVFQSSPNRSPPGTAGSQANIPSGPSRGPGPSPPPSLPSSAYVHPLRPGVPQHPSLSMYNPEPLIYDRKSLDVKGPGSNPEKMMAYQWARPQAQAHPQPGPPMPMPLPVLSPIPASTSSLTRVGSGSGGSEQQQQHQFHQPHPADQSSKPSTSHPPMPPAQNPPSPPPTPPNAQIQTHQKPDQRQSHLTTATATHEARPNVGSYGSNTDHRDAYGGIETDEGGVRVHVQSPSSSQQGHAASHMARPPPGYTESGPFPTPS